MMGLLEEDARAARLRWTRTEEREARQAEQRARALIERQREKRHRQVARIIAWWEGDPAVASSRAVQKLALQYEPPEADRVISLTSG